jgi:hypothetical protein
MHKRLLLISFLLSIVLILLYQVSEAFWNVRWFDSLMHFLGGLTIGMFSLWVWYASGLFGRYVPTKREVFIAALVFSMLVGIWWEFFEFANGIANPIGSYALDTFADITADLVGAIVAGIWGAKKHFYE